MGESMTFTPGPWRKYRDKNGRVSKLESIQGRVCTFHPSDANVEANATITESAPDMLAALLAVERAAQLSNTCEDGAEACLEWMAAADAAVDRTTKVLQRLRDAGVIA